MKKLSLFLGIPGMLLLALAPNALATPTLSFTVDGGAAISCADGDACDLNPTVGAVTYSNTLAGGFTINVTTGITKPVPTFESGEDLNSVDVNITGGTHDLVIAFSENKFTAPVPATLLGKFGGTLSFGAGSTVAGEGYYNTANVVGLADGTNLGTHSFTIGSFGPGAFSGTGSGPGPGTQPYALSEVIRLHTTTAGSFSGDFALDAVPEPTTVVLFGAVLLLTVNGLRRKLRA